MLTRRSSSQNDQCWSLQRYNLVIAEYMLQLHNTFMSTWIFTSTYSRQTYLPTQSQYSTENLLQKFKKHTTVFFFFFFFCCSAWNFTWIVTPSGVDTVSHKSLVSSDTIEMLYSRSFMMNLFCEWKSLIIVCLPDNKKLDIISQDGHPNDAIHSIKHKSPLHK